MYEPETRHHQAVVSAVIPSGAPLIPSGHRRVVGYTMHAGVPVPVYEPAAPTVVHQQRDLTPQPLIDPRAQILAAGGILAAGAGWGVGQVFTAFAGISGGSLMWLAFIVVAWRIGPALRRGDTHNHVTNNNSGFLAHSHTTNPGGR